jgi:hypothetical protein
VDNGAARAAGNRSRFYARRTRAQILGAAWKAREGYTLTYLPFIARAVSVALAKFPLLNASLDGDDLVVHNRINIGIAVDLNHEGLVVPVINDVPSKSLPQLARDINDIAQRARSNRLKVDELSGGTYTLSNSGVFRNADHCADHQSAAGCNPVDRRREQEAGGYRERSGRQHRYSADRRAGADIRSSRRRWRLFGCLSARGKDGIETRDWLQALNA